MNSKQNLHTHTTYADGKDTPEELIIEAIKRGFGAIGFSEHSYMEFSDYPYQMKVSEMADYQGEVRALKEKYRGEIDVFCGMEFESYSSVPTDGFDYLIGSVHYLKVGDRLVGFDRGLQETLDYVRDNFGGNGMAFAEKYYETVAQLPKMGNFDIIGHFDLVTKNNEKGDFINVNSKKYHDFGLEAIGNLKGKIPLFEVNTGAISRGYRTEAYPQNEFLKEFKNCGFGAVITSDCHDKNFLDCGFAEARRRLLAAGFRTHWMLTDSGFKEVEL